MPKRGQQGKQQPATFLLKTYQILQNDEHSEYITWADDGHAFAVPNVTGFSSRVLPVYFKHSNFSSFVRQLNMYDFHKRKDKDNVFEHPYFMRGRPEQLKLIKRKLPPPEDSLVPLTQEHSVEVKQKELEEWCRKVAQQNDQICKENQGLRHKLGQIVDQRNTEYMMIYLFLRSQYGDKMGKVLQPELTRGEDLQVESLPSFLKQMMKKGLRPHLANVLAPPSYEEKPDLDESRQVIPLSPMPSLYSMESEPRIEEPLDLDLSRKQSEEEDIDKFIV